MRDEELFLDAEAFRKQLRNCSYRDLVKIKTELEELLNLCEKRIPIQQSGRNAKGGSSYDYPLAYTKKVKLNADEKLKIVNEELETKQQLQK